MKLLSLILFIAAIFFISSLVSTKLLYQGDSTKVVVFYFGISFLILSSVSYLAADASIEKLFAGVMLGGLVLSLIPFDSEIGRLSSLFGNDANLSALAGKFSFPFNYMVEILFYPTIFTSFLLGYSILLRHVWSRVG